jgi:hypothetical protein
MPPSVPMRAHPMPSDPSPQSSSVRELVMRELDQLPIADVHTHLFDPGMEGLLLVGIDEVLTYHYHVAELFRARPDLDPDVFWAAPIRERADLVWRELFVERSPLSEVGKSVVGMLRAFGLDPSAEDLRDARAFFDESTRDLRGHVDRVLGMAGVREVCMTNDPLDAEERSFWEGGFERDPRFVAALRLDSAIMDWPRAVPALRALGYDVEEARTEATITALRRYLVEWYRRMDARYMAVSLPPQIGYPDSQEPWLDLLVRAVIPAAAEVGCPVALMIGVRRQVAPRLRLAGDSLGATDVESLERLANDHPGTRFYVTLLAREGQHALCIAARKFANLVPFGCWWFVNVPSVTEEITNMRLDLLGPTFVPQHSDARVLEQLVFKWGRSRAWLGRVFGDHYADLAASGGVVTAARVRRDLAAMLGQGFAMPRRD